MQAADTGRECCTQRWRGAAGVVPGGAPPFLFSTLLVPSTLHRAVEIGLLDHQGFTLLEGSQVLGRAWCAEPGVNALGREHRRRLLAWQDGNERLNAVVVSALPRSEDWRILEHRTRVRELQLIDDWLSNNLFDVRMQICRFGQNVRRD